MSAYRDYVGIAAATGPVTAFFRNMIDGYKSAHDFRLADDIAGAAPFRPAPADGRMLLRPSDVPSHRVVGLPATLAEDREWGYAIFRRGGSVARAP